MFIDEGDVRAHGKDERLRVEAYYQGCEYIFHWLKFWVRANSRRGALP